jgi:hypothetical protein
MSLSRLTVSPRRVGLLLAAALLAAALLSVAVARPAAASDDTSLRLIYNTWPSYMNIVDDEPWDDPDETGAFSLADPSYGSLPGYGGSGLDGLYLSSATPVATRQTSKCVGDEVRVVVQTKGELSTVYKDWVRVTLTARLYEGTSCSTNDLDGTSSTSFWIPPGGHTTQTMNVVNSDEGGDYASIKMNMTNLRRYS